MNVFTFVFLVVTVSLCARVIMAYLERRKSDTTPDEIERTMAKIDLLEERIQVLERIVTESRFDLRSRIDSL